MRFKQDYTSASFVQCHAFLVHFKSNFPGSILLPEGLNMKVPPMFPRSHNRITCLIEMETVNSIFQLVLHATTVNLCEHIFCG
jgi:hypothetical protein